MKEQKLEFTYEVYENISELKEEDARLLLKAREVLDKAYAPYSNFHVGAVAQLINGEEVTGTNQENASYPVGICAERVLLGTAANMFPEIPIKTMAISYGGKDVVSNHPISPCGMCRQALLEFENRVNQPIRVILGGMEGQIFILPSASFLLPFAFTKEELKKATGE